jgi:hypothetical protein
VGPVIQPAPASPANLATAVEFPGRNVLGTIVRLKDNVASIRLVEKVGLRRFVTTEPWILDRR